MSCHEESESVVGGPGAVGGELSLVHRWYTVWVLRENRVHWLPVIIPTHTMQRRLVHLVGLRRLAPDCPSSTVWPVYASVS